MNLIKGVRINHFNKSTEYNMTVHTHKSKMRVYACVQTRYMYIQTHKSLSWLVYCTISNGNYYGNNEYAHLV